MINRLSDSVERKTFDPNNSADQLDYHMQEGQTPFAAGLKANGECEVLIYGQSLCAFKNPDVMRLMATFLNDAANQWEKLPKEST